MRDVTRVPRGPLPATIGGAVDLSELPSRSVLFVYPGTSPPEGAPSGWDLIPGARVPGGGGRALTPALPADL